MSMSQAGGPSAEEAVSRCDELSFSSSSSGFGTASRGSSSPSELSERSDQENSDWEESEDTRHFQWPLDRALPLPQWGPEKLQELCFQDLDSFADFETLITQKLKENVEQLSYDTLSNFISFSCTYLSQRSEYPSLHQFYREYDPPLFPGRNTCVGLSLNLLALVSSLEEYFPGLSDSTYQVSCEEEIDQIDPYCATDRPPVTTCEKEHVLICIRIKIGERSGVVLLDPGYHLARPVVVMRDFMPPQTREFLANTKGLVTKSYSYEFHSNSAFVLWKVVERNGAVDVACRLSLIHVARPFLSGVDVAERRNLVYPFKSLLRRNKSGQLTAGLYFPIKPIDATRVTMFYVDEDQGGTRVETRTPLSFFLSNDEDHDDVLKVVEKRLCVGGGEGSVRRSLRVAAAVIQDEQFLQELNLLNDDVDKISRYN